MARKVRVQTMVPQEVQEKLREYAEKNLITESALVSMIIGQWLNQEKDKKIKR